eukprot:gene6653-13470_t
MNTLSLSHEDEVIQKTAIDALVCKHSASRLGYFKDDFIKYFYKKAAVRKPPIINRGYFARTVCISQTVQSFLSLTSLATSRQIINLGIGFDTFSLNLLQQNHPNLNLFEIDFEEVIHKKIATLFADNSLKSFLFSSTNSDEIKQSECLRNGSYHIGNLHLLPVDLRVVDSLTQVMQQAGVDPNLPTLIITECVLVYIEKQECTSLCSSISSYFTDAIWISYDMIRPDDTFGRVMKSNLLSAGHRVPGFIQYPTLESQTERFLHTGWDQAHSIDMLIAYETMIPQDKKREIQRIEIFDEIEEWELLMSHYCITVAIKCSELQKDEVESGVVLNNFLEDVSNAL